MLEEYGFLELRNLLFLLQTISSRRCLCSRMVEENRRDKKRRIVGQYVVVYLGNKGAIQFIIRGIHQWKLTLKNYMRIF